MLDWRTSPLAEAFFRAAPGEPYELETGDRVTEGRVRERWLLQGRGTLEALIGDDVDRSIAIASEPRLRPAPRPDSGAGSQRAGRARSRAAARGRPRRRYVARRRWRGRRRQDAGRAVSRRRARPRAPKARGEFRALVLVPTEGLRRLVRLLADRLRIPKLEIAVIDDWLVERARLAFPGCRSGCPKVRARR